MEYKVEPTDLLTVREWVKQYRTAIGKTARDRVRYEAAHALSFSAWMLWSYEVNRIDNFRIRLTGRG